MRFIVSFFRRELHCFTSGIEYLALLRRFLTIIFASKEVMLKNHDLTEML